MTVTHTVFSLKRLYGLLYMLSPLLEDMRLLTPGDPESITNLSAKLKIRGGKDSWQPILEKALADAVEPKKTDRFGKHAAHTRILLEEIATQRNNPFENTLPIYTSGLTITGYGRAEREGIDPYANSHLFSTLLINHLGWGRYQNEFLYRLRFMPVDPHLWVARFTHDDVAPGLEDITRKGVEEKINKPRDKRGKLGFGDLAKFNPDDPTIGNSQFRPEMFDASLIERVVEQTPNLIRDDATYDGQVDLERYVVEGRATVTLNRHIMAIAIGEIYRRMPDSVRRTIYEMGLKGPLVYAGKTSPSYEILKLVQRYNPDFQPHLVGGRAGPLANTPERMPIGEICHPTAFHKLIGALDVAAKKTRGVGVDVGKRISENTQGRLLRLSTTGHFPFLLLEEGTEHSEPNAHTLLNQKLIDGEVTDDEIELVRDFADMHRIGFQRIEPHVVNWLTWHREWYLGIRSMSAQNVWSVAELKNKKVVFPGQIPRFELAIDRENTKGDFRGSEFSLPTQPHINEDWLNELRGENCDVGCTLEKLLAGVKPVERKKLVTARLGQMDEVEREEYFRHHTSDLESIAAIRGSLIHAVGSDPMEGLVHYDTLKLAGIEPRPSDTYCELPFAYTFKNIQTADGTQDVTVTIHPDAFFFLQNQDGRYDIVILDTKTNRVTPYPEHKYILQTGVCYATVLENICEEQLDMDIDNVYLSYNKNAFHRGFGGTAEIIEPHETYRPQRQSPTIVLRKDDSLRTIFPTLLGHVMNEKQRLRQQPDLLPEYKQAQECLGRCNKCFHKPECDQLEAMYGEGVATNFTLAGEPVPL